MTTFLAIDFGTSNCSAALINANKELEYVPLDDNSFLLPSAIFVQVSQLSRSKIDEAQLLYRAEKLLVEDKLRHKRDLEIAKNKYRDFYNIYVPMARDPNKPYKKNSLRKYVYSNELDSAIDHFKNNELAEEKKRILEAIEPVKNISDIQKNLRVKFELDSIQSDIDLLSDESFFTAILDANSTVYFGSEALRKYTENPLSGFFLRSPKTFLGSSLNSRSVELFVKIIALIIDYIKVKSENHFGRQFENVVFGRPVNYFASDTDASNKQAISIMNSASLRVGFTDIRYVIEPFAAALVSRRTMFADKSSSILIDIGGGTTDVAIIGPGEEESGDLNIISSSGSRVGGDDFDQSISFQYFVEVLRQEIGEFHKIIIDALSTRDLQAQSRFAKAGHNIVSVLNKYKYPTSESYLYDMYRGQLQHKALLFSEDLKIILGKSTHFDKSFDFLNSSFRFTQENIQLNAICFQPIERIKEVVMIACKESNLEADSAKKVFITGGMSNSDELITIIKGFFPRGSVFYRLSPLNTIISGLAVAANYLSNYEINRPINSVYGVPVDRYVE
jgi:hypothetical chaperone protein